MQANPLLCSLKRLYNLLCGFSFFLHRNRYINQQMQAYGRIQAIHNKHVIRVALFFGHSSTLYSTAQLAGDWHNNDFIPRFLSLFKILQKGLRSRLACMGKFVAYSQFLIEFIRREGDTVQIFPILKYNLEWDNGDPHLFALYLRNIRCGVRNNSNSHNKYPPF